eukprot:GHVT01089850.1.p1 GENE.GHVT01089850.1~~GHVT01089850.1.p1  ORF type:complete len:361 (-),score=83.98 GHVT01089850.1:549-1631(-)
MGRKGSAITIVSPEERLKAKQIIREANGLAQGTGGKRGRAEEGGGAGTAANAIKLSKVNPQELQEWKQKFFAQKHSIAKYLTAERREKMMRLADIELSKAENLITYKDAIQARPKRVWIATKEEKALQRKRESASHLEGRERAGEYTGRGGHVGNQEDAGYEEDERQTKKKKQKKKVIEQDVERANYLDEIRHTATQNDQEEDSMDEGRGAASSSPNRRPATAVRKASTKHQIKNEMKQQKKQSARQLEVARERATVLAAVARDKKKHRIPRFRVGMEEGRQPTSGSTAAQRQRKKEKLKKKQQKRKALKNGQTSSSNSDGATSSRTKKDAHEAASEPRKKRNPTHRKGNFKSKKKYKRR